MTWRRAKVWKILGPVILVVVVLAAGTPMVKTWLKPKNPNATDTGNNHPALVGRDSIQLPVSLVKNLGVRTAKAEKAIRPAEEDQKYNRLLVLNGTLGPDTDKLLIVKPRFPGEVEKIGDVREPATTPTRFRPITNGDWVTKGQLLAVIINKDLGQQKSALLNALSQLRLDQLILERLEEAYKKGAISLRAVNEARTKVENDQIAVDAAKRTLGAWRLTDQEIDEIDTEARRIAKLVREGGKLEESDRKKWAEKWARVEVLAPFDGKILERNIREGAIVDTTTNLFFMGDLNRLSVWAWVYEDDLPLLQALPSPVPWIIRLKAVEEEAKPISSHISEIRPFIDPTVHAALVRGYVPNSEGKLAVGQNVTATVQLPPDPNEIVILTSALVEDGSERVIFVQSNPKEYVYEMRPVQVLRRGKDKDGRPVVHLRWVWPEMLTFLSSWPGDCAGINLALAGLFEGSQSDRLNPIRRRIKPEEEAVVISGGLELRAALKDLQDSAKPLAASLSKK
jgi:cobalt-zinc-cadmium efflux system membrane fusion protein